VSGPRRGTRSILFIALAAHSLAWPALAAERELDDAPAPGSASEISTPMKRVFAVDREQRPILQWLEQRLEELPAFFADSQLEVRYRTYYLRQDRTSGTLIEGWAMGGSVHYQSGWLADFFAVEAEGFTSQPIVAPEDRGGTLLLEPVQEGYTVLGISNAKLRYGGIVLTGYRQYLDLPYVNRRDNRMTPQTFESITLARPEGELRFSTGYSWKIKRRSSDEFESFTEAIGLDEDRGFAHGGVVWNPHENFHAGVIGGAVPDLYAGLYSEASAAHDFANGLEVRVDSQFTYQWEVGEDLVGTALDDTWNLGVRAVASYAGVVFRLGVSVTDSGSSIFSSYGTNPSYVDLMQRTFTRADEKALLASLSYDFSNLGIDGLTLIANFVAGFDGEQLGVRSDAQEVDATLDYRIQGGWFEGFWLRVRGSWLNEETAGRDGTDVRVMLRYDLPVL
jgi:hypothetical protein